MSEIGLFPLLSHLQACPPDFFRPLQIPYAQWSTIIPALLHDFLSDHVPYREVQNQLNSTKVLNQPAQAEWLPPLCWLLSHPLFETVIGSDSVLPLLLELAQHLGAGFPPREVLNHPQRAEECLRALISRLHWPIQHESTAQSDTQLTYLSSVQKQQRVQLRQHKREREAAILKAQQRLLAMDNAD
ncbi:MAG: hypothetical protein IV090_11605 [Candidatus Sericytochromatia bacterium]|nr:hypothetical protein [Candidatus Sericytochromatia bacterium]